MIYLGRDPIGINNDINTMKLIKTYVVPESWENDTKGNPQTIFNTIMSGETATTHEIYVFVVLNNTASQQNYAGNVIIMVSNNFGSNDTFGAVVRNNWQNVRQGISGISFWISQGATVKVYKMDIPT